MANTLMFEVGVQEAKGQLTALENRLKDIVDKYGSMKIKVEVDQLQSFINALKTIGNGEQLKPLLDRIDSIQSSLTKLNGSMGNVDLSSLKKQLNIILDLQNKIKNTSDDLKAKGATGLQIKNATASSRTVLDNQIRTLEKNFGMTIEQAKHYVNTAETAGNASSKLERNIERLSQSITDLSNKSFSVNIGNEFKTWAEQVQNLVTQVGTLVAQMEKLHQVQGSGGGQTQTGLFDTTKFSTLQEAVDKIISEINRLQQAFTHLGENNSLSNLTTYINGLAVTLSTLSNAIKLQPLDEQTKRLIEENEMLKQKLIEVGEAAKYINVRNGDRTQDKTAEIQRIAGVQSQVTSETAKSEEAVENYSRSLNIAKYRVDFLLNALKDAKNVSGQFNDNGFETSKIDSYIEKLNRVRQELELIAGNKGLHPFTGQTASEVLREADISGIERNLKSQLNYYQQISKEFEKIESLKANLSNLLGGITDNAKRQEIQGVINDLRDVQGLVMRQGTNEARFIFGSKEYKDLLSNSTVLLKERSREIANGQKEQKRAASEEQKSVNEASIKWERLGVKIREIQELRNKGAKLGLDVSELNNYIQAIARVRKELYDIMNNPGQYKTTGITGLPVGLTTSQLMSNEAVQRPFILGQEAVSKFSGEVKTATSNVSQLTSEEQKLAQAISHSSNEMRGQSQILSDLKMMAMQYVSVWGAQSFINSIIETGGLLEQQRLSIGAILQNAGQATELFGQIKQLALKSPFGVVELDKMSKQLTAYGFEYKELYDWTKRLADISAATGTSVDRLALALGHVRAEGALSGYTLRQFAMGNVPLLRMLAENLNITTKQVREKVRKKDISYDDVMEVLRQLTDKGGMFYEAQETMSQALNAKFKNLRDAFDIMYGEIAESSVGDALKELAVILTSGAKHWKELADVIKWSAGAFLVAKAAMMLCNQAIGAGTAATLKSAAADKQKQVNMLRLAKEYRALSAAEWQLLATHSHWYATSGKLTQAQLTLLLNEKKLGKEELYRSVALGKVNKELALKAALEMKAGTATERHAKAELLWGLRGVQTLSKWRVGWITLGNAIRSAGAALWSFTKIALPMAAFSAIVELFARTSAMKEQAKEMSSDLAEKAASDLKMLNETMKDLQDNDYFKYSETGGKYVNGRRVVTMGIEFKEEALKKEDLTDEIANLKNKLQDLSPMYEGDLIDIDKMNNQVEQFKLIVRKLESIRHANDVTEAMSGVVAEANEDVAGNYLVTQLFGDTYTQDVKDYEEAMSLMAKRVNSINEEKIDEIDEELDGKLAEIQKKYSLDSKNSALAKLFADWSRTGGLPKEYKSMTHTTLVDEIFGKATDKKYLLFGGTLKEQYEQMLSDTKEMAEKISSIIVNEFQGDPDGAIYAIATYMKNLMASSGVTDPRVIEEATRMMLDEMRGFLPEDMRNGVVDEMQRRILMEKFSGFMGNVITESTTPEEAEKALEKYSDITIKWGEQMGYDMKKLGMDNAEAYRKGLDAKLNAVKLNTDWQKRASSVFVHNVSIKSNFDKSLDEFAQAVQKDLKEKQDYLKRNQGHLKMTLKIDTDILMNADKLRKFMDKLALEGQKKAAEGDWEGAQAIYSRIDKEITPYYNALLAVSEDKEWLKKEGYPEKDPTKGGKGSQEDKNAKAVRERVRILKEAADSFQYWREKVGDKAAWSHVKSEFGDVLEEIGVTAENVEDFKGNLNKILNSSEFNAIKDKKVKLEVEKEISKEMSQFNRKDFEKSTEEFASTMSREIEDLTRKWEIFNSVVTSTGDRLLAARMSGISPGATPADLKRTNVASFAGVDIDFGKVLGMSDKEIDEYVYSLGVVQQKIKAVQDGLKDWKKSQLDITKSDIQNYAKWLGGLVDLQSILNRNQEEYNTILEETNRLRKEGLLSDTEANNRIDSAMSTRMSKDWEASVMYSRLYNNSQQMASNEFDQAYSREIYNLNTKLQQGTITFEQYNEKVSKLNQIQREFKTTGFLGIKGGLGAYLGGGYQGLIDYHKSKASDLRTQGLTAEAQEEEDKATAMTEALNAAEQVAKAFQDLATGADFLGNMFEALGMDGMASGMGDAASLLGGVASGAQSLSGLGPWGMAAGAAIGGITSLAQMHDKSQERLIEALKRDVAALEANTESIKNARSRTLGYDNDSLRKAYAAAYSEDDKRIVTRKLANGKELQFVTENKASKAMLEYYGANSKGSGYAQELKNLQDEREKYIEMYNEEEDKKKSSKESLSEYTKKIAELDEQIIYFTQDLANELWGIDIKGWASQISDALWTAFENGEDAVKAFGDTAKSIVSDVAKKMMNLHLIEPMFADLEEELFGKMENGKRVGGVAYTNGVWNEKETLEVLGKYFGENGTLQKVISDAEDFYRLAERASGMNFSGSSSTSSKVIQGGFTENETGLLLSYVNGMRADLSINRAMIAEYFPMYYDVMTRGNNQLISINQHAAEIERTNQIISEKVDRLDSDFHGLRTGLWRMPMA